MPVYYIYAQQTENCFDKEKCPKPTTKLKEWFRVFH